jgi:hypothetical protein
MYERTTPVCAGEMLKRVATVSMETARINSVPRKSRRTPSHRWFNISTDMMQAFSKAAKRIYLIRDRHPVCPVLDVHQVSIFVIEAVLFPVCTNGGNPRQCLREM